MTPQRFDFARRASTTARRQNLHRGDRAFAEGLHTAIRNRGMPRPQESDGGEERLALERFAAFSLLARWADKGDPGDA